MSRALPQLPCAEAKNLGGAALHRDQRLLLIRLPVHCRHEAVAFAMASGEARMRLPQSCGVEPQPAGRSSLSPSEAGRPSGSSSGASVPAHVLNPEREGGGGDYRQPCGNRGDGEGDGRAEELEQGNAAQRAQPMTAPQAASEAQTSYLPSTRSPFLPSRERASRAGALANRDRALGFGRPLPLT